MGRTLSYIPFLREYVDLPAVRDFDCGNEPWEREVSDWIRGCPGGVLDSMDRGCEVWLYATEDDGLVGYGSLAPSNWRWPLTDSPRVPISVIPSLGIQRAFWGKPEGPPEERFSAQVVDHLIQEARERTDRHPLLALFVHPKNVRARRVYEKAGFISFSKTYTDRDTGVVYDSMILNLSDNPSGG